MALSVIRVSGASMEPTLSPGARVVIEPALSCAVRGVKPPCQPCAAGHYAHCEKITQGDIQSGIQAYRALLQLDPPDPAEVHFDLARLLRRAGEPEARRQILQALEEAPRYRAALQLLLEINGQTPSAKADEAKLTLSGER